MSAKHQAQSGFHMSSPFRPHLLFWWEIKKSHLRPSVFPLRRTCHSEISADRQEVCGGGCALQRLWSFSGPELAENLKKGASLFGLRFISVSWECWTIFFCLPAMHSVDLNRCSPSASHYLQHPPIICFTNLPPPPSPLLASPLILNLDHPSAARNCVSTAYEDTSHRAYI